MTQTIRSAAGRTDRPVLCTVRVVDRRPIAVTIEVEGEIDVACFLELGDAVADVRGRCDGAPLVLDLSGVTFADSTLARLVVQLRGAAQQQGTCLRVTGVNGQARRVLTLLGLDDSTVTSLACEPGAALRR